MALAEARASGERAQVERLGAAIGVREKEVTARIAAAFASSALDNIAPLIGELRYYRRFLDEVSAIEDSFSERASAPSSD